MLNKRDLDRLKKIAAESPAQQRINAVTSVEDLGKFVGTLRVERADLVSGVDLEAFLETFVAVCARARTNRQLWDDELSEKAQWRDFADLIYTALLYE